MARELIAIGTSDWHLQDKAWSSHPSLVGDSLFSLHQIVSLAIEHRVPILAAGDLTDTLHPPTHVLRELRNDIEWLRDAHVPLLFTQGQHEKSYPPWLNVLSDYPIHLHETRYLLDSGHFVYGMDHRPATLLAEMADRIPEGHSILMCHQVWKEFMGENLPSEGSLTMLAPTQLVITGDYHHTEQIEVEFQPGAPPFTVLSPGSTCMQEIAEPPDKYVWLIYDDLSAERSQLLTRPFLQTSLVSDEQELDNLLAILPSQVRATTEEASRSMPEKIAVPIVRVWHVAGLDVKRRVEQQIGSEAHLFFKDEPGEKADTSAAVLAASSVAGGGLAGCLSMAVSEEREPDLFQDLLRLVSSHQTAEQELKDMEEEVYQKLAAEEQLCMSAASG